jgi:kynurenine formamidase
MSPLIFALGGKTSCPGESLRQPRNGAPYFASCETDASAYEFIVEETLRAVGSEVISVTPKPETICVPAAVFIMEAPDGNLY